jgi:hypothetical protein
MYVCTDVYMNVCVILKVIICLTQAEQQGEREAALYMKALANNSGKKGSESAIVAQPSAVSTVAATTNK